MNTSHQLPMALATATPPLPPRRSRSLSTVEVRASPFASCYEKEIGEFSREELEKITMELFERNQRLQEENQKIALCQKQRARDIEQLNSTVLPELNATIERQIDDILRALREELPEIDQIVNDCRKEEKLQLPLLIARLKEEQQKRVKEKNFSQSAKSFLSFQFFEEYTPSANERASEGADDPHPKVSIPLERFITQLEEIDKFCSGKIAFSAKIDGERLLIDGKRVDKEEARSMLSQCLLSLGSGICTGIYYSGKGLYYTLCLIFQLSLFITLGASFFLNPWVAAAYFAGRIALSAACFGSIFP